jgi:hypothetical protein
MGRVMDFFRHPFTKNADPDVLRERDELRGKAEIERRLARLSASEFLDQLTQNTIADITPGRRQQ